MKTKYLLVLMIVALLVGVSGFAISFLPAAVASASAQPATAAVQQTTLSVPGTGTIADFQSSLENIYTQVNPSVVLIQVVEGAQSATPNTRRSPFGGTPQQSQPSSALGSGFVWDMQGHIVTNNHVVSGATTVTVTFSDGTTVPAKVVGTDPSSDLAVIQVNVASSQLHPVQLADSAQVQVGQFAIAIGNPYGEQNTMTTGIISALGRSLPASDGATQGPSYTIPDVIQTDAPINPGNSGGVLLNADGQVVGVTSAIESQSGASSGIGFAIPSAIVKKVVPALISTGHYDHPYIGIGGTSLTPDLAQAMGLQVSQRGALVATVTAGSPAAKAGLQGGTQQVTASDGTQAQVGGDVIIAVNGQSIKSFDDLSAYLADSAQINQTVTLTILRNGKQQTVQVTLTARPGSST